MARRLADPVSERLNETKRALILSQVSGGVGHEFNNILTRVICLAEDIQDEPDLRIVHARAEALIETAERGAEIVRRLMTYASNTLVVVKPVDIGQAVAEWGDDQAAEDLTVAADGGGATAMVDPLLLGPVLDELLKNARQAGATRIEVACTSEPDDRTSMVVFKDNGSGMDAATASRATEPFFTTRTAGEGVGLGLSIVKGALNQWGGRMQLMSQPGKGTEVRLVLSTPGALPPRSSSG